MPFTEYIHQALATIRSSLLRSMITMLIIAFGITAIVGVLTSIDGIKYWLASTFSTLGSNTFKIENRATTVRIGGRRNRTEVHPPITYYQATELKKRLGTEAVVSVRTTGQRAGQLKFRNRTTNNNIAVFGTDENFARVESYEIAEGRNIGLQDVIQSRRVIVIGAGVREMLFPYGSALNQEVQVQGNYYRVIGVLAKKGTSFGALGDKVTFLPATTLMRDYSIPSRNFTINVYVEDAEQLPEITSRSMMQFRLVRGLRPAEKNNFAILLSDTFISNLMDNLSILTFSSTIIAFISLFGASVGLMNIMLVSVTERTMEIGLRKALGATRRQILWQFLIEAITICQLGGLLGIVLGLGMGNLIGAYLNSPFLIPWGWILLAIVICFVVGIASGIYPARRAARLDPIDSLRYE